MKKMTIALAALVGVGAVVAPARADHDSFLGWSADRSYFAKAAQDKEDAKKYDTLTLCSDEAKPTWPKEVGSAERAPIFGAPGTCVTMFFPGAPLTV